MIDISNNAAKQRILFETVRIQQNIEKSFSTKVGDLLYKQFNDAAKSVQDSRPDEALIINHTDAMVAAFVTVYRRSASVFSDKLFEEAEKSFTLYFQKGVIEDFWNSMESYFKINAVRQVTKITEATRKTLSIAIEKGIRDGKSYVEIARDVRKVGKIQRVWRARRIARTEVHSASTSSLQVAAEASRLIKEKEWLSANDSRTRTSPFDHVGANGETVLLDAMFQLTGESLMYPGDQLNGSVGNIVNCRCIQLFHSFIKSMSGMRRAA